MKNLLFILAFISSITLNAQEAELLVVSELPTACQIKSINFLAFETGVTQTIDLPKTISYTPPVDLFMVFAQGTNGANKNFGPTYVQGDTLRLKLENSEECESMIISSKADELWEDYYAFTEDPANKNASKIFEKIKAYDSNIFVLEYLNFYRSSEAMNPIISKSIVDHLEAANNRVSSVMIIQQSLGKLKATYEEQSFKLSEFDFISYKRNHLIDKPAKEYQVYEFWFSQCAPCIKDQKIIRAEIDKGDFPKNAELIGISIDMYKSDWENFLDQKEVKWKNFHIGDYKNKGVFASKYGIYRYPTYIITNKKGEIVKRVYGYQQVKEFLEEID